MTNRFTGSLLNIPGDSAYRFYGIPSLLMRITIAVVCLLCVTTGVAQSATDLYTDPVPFAFTKLPVGARNLSLAGASSVLFQSPEGVFTNPALLGPVSGPLFRIDLGTGLDDETDGGIALAIPWSSVGTFGVGLRYLSIHGIEFREYDTERPVSEFSTSDMEFVVSLGRDLGGGLSAGLSAKILREDLHEVQVTAPALDTGLFYRRSSLSLGLAVRNIGRDAKFKESSHPLPLAWEGAVGYEFMDSTLTAVAGFLSLSAGDRRTRLGLEYQPHPNLALRSGIALNTSLPDDDRRRFYFGLGTGNRRFRFDYAMSPGDALGNMHRFSLSAPFESLYPSSFLSSDDPGEQEGLPVEILNASFLDELYPAKQKFYVDNPIGEVSVRNNSGKAIDRVDVSVSIAKFTHYPTEIIIGPVGRGDVSEPVPLKVLLDLEKALHVYEDTPVQVVVEATCTMKGRIYSDRLVRTIVLRSANGMDWSDPRMLAAFITPNDRTVKEFARGSIGAGWEGDRGLLSNYATAASIHSSMKLISMKYMRDPNQQKQTDSGGSIPDRVQYPRETLQWGSGDCDDTAVLFASCLMNLGIRTFIADTPKHVFVLFDTGIPSGRGYFLGLREEKSVEIDGRIFLPVETTDFSSDFAEACEKGASALTRWRGLDQFRLIDVSRSWNMYESVSLPGTPPPAPTIDPSRLSMLIDVEMDALIRKRNEGFDTEITRLEQAILNTPRSASLRNDLGIAFAVSGKTDEARELFRSITRDNPEYIAARNNLANVMCMLDSLKEAKKHLHLASQNDPLDGGILFNLGICHTLEQQSTEAVSTFARAIRRFSSNDEARSVTGIDFLTFTEYAPRGNPGEIPLEEMEDLILQALNELRPLPESQREEESEEPVVRKIYGPNTNTLVRMLWGRAEQTESRDLETVLYWKR